MTAKEKADYLCELFQRDNTRQGEVDGCKNAILHCQEIIKEYQLCVRFWNTVIKECEINKKP